MIKLKLTGVLVLFLRKMDCDRFCRRWKPFSNRTKLTCEGFWFVVVELICV